MYEQADWPKMIEFLVDAGTRLEAAFREVVKKKKTAFKN